MLLTIVPYPTTKHCFVSTLLYVFIESLYVAADSEREVGLIFFSLPYLYRAVDVAIDLSTPYRVDCYCLASEQATLTIALKILHPYPSSVATHLALSLADPRMAERYHCLKSTGQQQLPAVLTS